MTLEKSYNPAQSEQACYAHWEKSGYFKARDQGADPYCIMIPPPNVTGTLHMGHAFQQTLMDILIRVHRMQGDQTLWQVGTDHAGIATQMVVERQLLAQGHSKHDVGREAFVQQIWEWKEKSGGQITQQLRRMGASVDWSRERFTLDEGLSQAVIEVFVQLYREGLIYRGKRLVNWDPSLQTAVSDLEVIAEEEEGSLWHIRYPLCQNPPGLFAKGVKQAPLQLVVATTRPETLLGDVAVAVHPDDERYQPLIGQFLQLPLTDRLIPIVADATVDPTFGTGCVKITPGHDFNDYALAKKHDLPLINIFDYKACLNQEVPLPYRGLDRFEARKKIIAVLQSQNLIEKIEPHRLRIPRGDKSGAILEPLLTDQWFVKVDTLAKPAIEAVEQGQIRFVPESWSKTYFEWMHNIQDWCISRQLWWGHRIPAWFDEQGQIYVAATEAEARLHYQLPASLILKQDEDVLDTWFSSALWPFSTLDWPHKTPELATFYPTQVLVTGFDIIFFWVARMIMLGLKFTGQVPFHEVYIHGLIQDHLGQKMSKTKGNGIDPLDLIDGIDLESLLQKRTQGLMQPQLAASIAKETRKQFPNGIPAYGTDALRFTFAMLATPGRAIRFDTQRVETYKHFCNKIWNAARYVLMHTENSDLQWNSTMALHIVDRWILSEWQQAKEKIQTALKEYRFDLSAQAIYEFIWNEYCDWYLEFSKPLLQSKDPSVVLATRRTLLSILEEFIRVIHPFMPYITESIWQCLAPLCQKSGDTIMLQPYPEFLGELVDKTAEQEIHWLKNIILSIRNIRGEMNIPLHKHVTLFVQHASPETQNRFIQFQPLLGALAKVESIEWQRDHDPDASDQELRQSPYATAVMKDCTLLMPLVGLVDLAAEQKRLAKNIDKLNEELEKINQQLANENFKAKASAHFIDTLSTRSEELQQRIAKLNTVF